MEKSLGEIFTLIGEIFTLYRGNLHSLLGEIFTLYRGNLHTKMLKSIAGQGVSASYK